MVQVTNASRQQHMEASMPRPSAMIMEMTLPMQLLRVAWNDSKSRLRNASSVVGSRPISGTTARAKRLLRPSQRCAAAAPPARALYRTVESSHILLLEVIFSYEAAAPCWRDSALALAPLSRDSCQQCSGDGSSPPPSMPPQLRQCDRPAFTSSLTLRSTATAFAS